MEELVRLSRAGDIATVTLHRPERRNALSDGLLAQLAHVLAQLQDDAATRAVIVTGAPPAFSAGADAPFRSGMTEGERRQAFAARTSQFRRLFERATGLLENLEPPTIAAINGPAVGGGWGLALACDFRIASPEARFWIPEVELGVPLGVGSTTRFVRLVGPARAKEIIMEGRRYSAEEVLALGLVHRVVPASDLLAAAREHAERLLARPYRPLVEAKARINQIARVGTPEVNAMTEGFLERG
jgi:enoyl-CoA hydratase/carnithine racemase